MAEELPDESKPPSPSRLEVIVSELYEERDLINSGKPFIIEIHGFEDEVKTKVSRWRNRKIAA